MPGCGGTIGYDRWGELADSYLLIGQSEHTDARSDQVRHDGIGKGQQRGRVLWCYEKLHMFFSWRHSTLDDTWLLSGVKVMGLSRWCYVRPIGDCQINNRRYLAMGSCTLFSHSDIVPEGHVSSWAHG